MNLLYNISVNDSENENCMNMQAKRLDAIAALWAKNGPLKAGKERSLQTQAATNYTFTYRASLCVCVCVCVSVCVCVLSLTDSLSPPCRALALVLF